MQFAIPVSIRLDTNLYKSIKAYAKENGLGVSVAIRWLLKGAIENASVKANKKLRSN